MSLMTIQRYCRYYILMHCGSKLIGVMTCSRGLVVRVVDLRPRGCGFEVDGTSELALCRCASKIWVPCRDLDSM